MAALGPILKNRRQHELQTPEILRKIVDIGSLTRAAEVLHIAQPALSQQVATLEGELNQQLLIHKTGVTPTDAGKILYTHARAILRQCEQAQLAVHNVGQALSGQVSIGFAPEPLRHPSPCPYYRRFALNSRRSLFIFMKIAVQYLTKTDKSPTRYGGDL